MSGKKFATAVGWWGIASAGALAAVVAFGDLAGWLHGGPFPENGPDFVPMVFNSAVCFLLGALALGALLFSFPRVARWSAFLALLVAGVTLLQYATGLNFGLDEFFVRGGPVNDRITHPGRMPAVNCFSFLFLGGSLILATFRDRNSWFVFGSGILASFSIGLALISAIGYFSGFVDLVVWTGDLAKMAVHSSVDFLLLGSAVLIWCSLRPGELGGGLVREWVAWSALILMLGITLGFCHALEADQRRKIRQNLILSAEGAGRLLQAEFKSSSQTLERMARHSEARGGTPKQEWEDDAGMYLRQSQFNRLIGRVEASGALVWHVPLSGDRFLDEKHLIQSEQLRFAMDRARKLNHSVISLPYEIEDIGHSLIIVVPVELRGKPDGFILGVLNFDIFFEMALWDPISQGFRFALKSDGKVFEASALKNETLDETLRNSPWRVETVVDLGTFRPVLELWPSEAWLKSARSSVAKTALVLGTLFSILMALTIFLSRAALRSRDEARRVSLKLQELAGLQKTILDSSSYMIISTRPDGVIETFNPAAEKTLGCSALRVIDSSKLTDVLRPQEGDSNSSQIIDIEKFLELPRQGQPVTREWICLRADGTEFPVMMTVTRLNSQAGRESGFLAMGMDITERKRSERDLAAARDEALESARLKSEFLANMSHEIRTPMNGIIGMTGLLLDTRLSEKQLEQAETIRSCAESLLTVINDILDFSKIEAGKLSFEKIEFSVRDTVEESMTVLAGTAHLKKIELTGFVSPQVPERAWGDPGRLRQVLYNLLSNGIKFTEKGEVVLRVDVQRQDKQDMVLRFTVADTGIGIAAEAQKRLFQPFTQADGSTTRHYGGTGLGLAICKQLISLMDGEIRVSSLQGAGSTFEFTVKLGVSAENDFTGPAPWKDLAGLRVLVVDDNETNRKILEERLDGWKMRTESAAGGAEALECLRRAESRQEGFDLALLDFQMPDQDGLMLAREIRSHERWRQMQLILLTSGMAATPAELEAAGISVCLTKPVRHLFLMQALHRAMASSPLLPKGLVGGAPTGEAQPGLQILLAEDNPVNQRVTLFQLEKMGYQVEIVNNGQEVLQALDRKHYDVVLMDCQMPVMDGFEATRQIRKRQGEDSRVLIVALTANALKGDREICLQAGMDDYISKPVRMDDLRRVLNQIAERAGATARWSQWNESMEADTMAKVVEAFASSSQEKMKELHVALRKGEMEKIAQAAHFLKSSCGQLDFGNCGALCEKIEAMSRSGQQADLVSLVVQLDRGMEEIYASLHRLKKAEKR